jgi:hypothetical protein
MLRIGLLFTLAAISVPQQVVPTYADLDDDTLLQPVEHNLVPGAQTKWPLEENAAWSPYVRVRFERYKDGGCHLLIMSFRDLGNLNLSRPSSVTPYIIKSDRGSLFHLLGKEKLIMHCTESRLSIIRVHGKIFRTAEAAARTP